jgi:hypothetical protein
MKRRESQLSISMQFANFAAEKNPETRKSLWMLLFSYFFGIYKILFFAESIA